MKLVEMKCKNCGAKLEVDEDATEVTCQYCKTTFKIDDEIQHVQYDNAEQTGYEFEKGRLRAKQELEDEKIRKQEEARIQRENIANEELRKKKALKWWIIGWIFFFPIPLTILIWRSNLEKNIKIVITAVLWIVLVLIGVFGNNDANENTINPENEENIVMEIETRK